MAKATIAWAGRTLPLSKPRQAGIGKEERWSPNKPVRCIFLNSASKSLELTHWPGLGSLHSPKAITVASDGVGGACFPKGNQSAVTPVRR